MTYEDLIRLIDHHAKTLPASALRLFIYLLAKAIDIGSNEVKSTIAWLAFDLGHSRDTVRSAARALAPIVGVTTRDGVGYTFEIPIAWLPQPRHFGRYDNEGWGRGDAMWKNEPRCLETRQQPPGNQAGSRLETRQPTTVGGLETRQQPPGNQAGSTTGCLETRQLGTQNQQLADGARNDLIRSDLYIPEQYSDLINQIIAARLVENTQTADALELREHLRAYMQDLGPRNLWEDVITEELLARCLAIAPLGDLKTVLRMLRQQDKRPSETYGWFVTCFAQRCHGIPPKLLRAVLRTKHPRRKQREQQDLEFTAGLLDEATGQVRRLA